MRIKWGERMWSKSIYPSFISGVSRADHIRTKNTLKHPDDNNNNNNNGNVGAVVDHIY